MKIGLIRHFRVKHTFPVFCNSENYEIEYVKYEDANIFCNNSDFPVKDYSVCYSSDKKRALNTAKMIFKRNINITSDLVEVPIKAIFKIKIKIPFIFWNILHRFFWFLNSKKLSETRKDTRARAVEFLAKICKSNKENILIVTHGFFMLSLRSELLKLGFKGGRILNPRNGILYEFENSDFSKKK